MPMRTPSPPGVQRRNWASITCGWIAPTGTRTRTPQNSETIPNGSRQCSPGGTWRSIASAATIPPERPEPDEPVAQTDLLAFGLAARCIVDRYLDDPCAARHHPRCDLVIQFEAARFERQRSKIIAPEQFVRGHRIGDPRTREEQRNHAQASPAQVCGDRLVRMPAGTHVPAAVDDI